MGQKSFSTDLQTPCGLQFGGIGFDARAAASNISTSFIQGVGCDGRKPDSESLSYVRV